MQRSLGELFARWGIPTAESVAICRRILPDRVVIASGGIRNGIEIAKALALGADAAASRCRCSAPRSARSRSGRGGSPRLVAELRTAMFLTGCADACPSCAPGRSCAPAISRRPQEPGFRARGSALRGEAPLRRDRRRGRDRRARRRVRAGQRGHGVLVLEHEPPGRRADGRHRRRGFHFDVGCQSFEDMGIVFPLLEQYGLADLAPFRRARYRVVMPGARRGRGVAPAGPWRAPARVPGRPPRSGGCSSSTSGPPSSCAGCSRPAACRTSRRAHERPLGARGARRRAAPPAPPAPARPAHPAPRGLPPVVRARAAALAPASSSRAAATRA